MLQQAMEIVNWTRTSHRQQSTCLQEVKRNIRISAKQLYTTHCWGCVSSPKFKLSTSFSTHTILVLKWQPATLFHPLSTFIIARVDVSSTFAAIRLNANAGVNDASEQLGSTVMIGFGYCVGWNFLLLLASDNFFGSTVEITNRMQLSEVEKPMSEPTPIHTKMCIKDFRLNEQSWLWFQALGTCELPFVREWSSYAEWEEYKFRNLALFVMPERKLNSFAHIGKDKR